MVGEDWGKFGKWNLAEGVEGSLCSEIVTKLLPETISPVTFG